MFREKPHKEREKLRKNVSINSELFVSKNKFELNAFLHLLYDRAFQISKKAISLNKGYILLKCF
jgi:hypothetical protein